MKKLVSLLAICTVLNSNAQTPFMGVPGIFVLGSVDVPMSTSEYTKSFVTGTAVRTKWESIEPSPGVYDWSFLDNEISNAASYGKKINISILGKPSWLVGEGVTMYDYIDLNPAHTTYLDTLQEAITWSSSFVSQLKNLVTQLSIKYANDTNVVYVNCISGMMNNNLPTNDIAGNPWYTTYSYDPDTLIAAMEDVMDHYMSVFPNTPLWNSVENVSFEMAASGNANKYVPEQYSNYGVATYPDRFGIWREDLAGCTNTTTTTGHWSIVVSNPCRIGAQMLWNVQDGSDGTFRMNNCGFTPNTKDHVLDSAMQTGISIGMRYFEIYKADIDDASLATILQNGHDSLMNIASACMPLVTGVSNVESSDIFSLYPNPTSDALNIVISESKGTYFLYNTFGQLILTGNLAQPQITLDISMLHSGNYFLQIITDNKSASKIFTKE